MENVPGAIVYVQMNERVYEICGRIREAMRRCRRRRGMCFKEGWDLWDRILDWRLCGAFFIVAPYRSRLTASIFLDKHLKSHIYLH
jgi:hypothetical protein